MKTNIYLKVSINIVYVFMVAILVSFIPDSLHEFFGDWLCNGSGTYDPSSYSYTGFHYGDCGRHDPSWHWGYRHWLWSFMGIILFVVQVIRIGTIINKASE